MATPTTARTTARRAASSVIPELSEDKAHVTQVTTKEFIEKKDEKNSATNPAPASGNPIPNVPPTFFLTQHTSASPRNSLPYLAEVLAEDGEDQYVAIITRIADVYNDNFFAPNFSDQNFPPMQFSPQGMMLNFIPSVQKFNNDSGGRFSIVVCQMNGEPVENARLNNFVIANPPRVETPVNSGNGNDAGLVAMMREVMERSERNMATLIASLQNNNKDRFTELAETVLMRKLSEESKPASNPEDVMLKMMMMPQMVETFADKMRDAMNGGGSKEDDSPTWLKLAQSDFGAKIGERAGGILENITALGKQMAQQKMAQPTAPPVPPVQYQPPPSPHPATPAIEITGNPIIEDQDDTEEVDEMKALIEDIIEELESENAIDDNNGFIKELAVDYPMESMFVKMMCQSEPFEKLTGMLMQKAPEAFAGMMEVGEDGKTPRLTERGVKIESRLREFYEYYKAKD